MGEGRDGLLAKDVPEAAPLRDAERRILEAENKDRLLMFQAYAEVLLAESGLPLEENIELMRSEFASSAKELAEPGEWVQNDQGRWARKG